MALLFSVPNATVCSIPNLPHYKKFFSSFADLKITAKVSTELIPNLSNLSNFLSIAHKCAVEEIQGIKGLLTNYVTIWAEALY